MKTAGCNLLLTLLWLNLNFISPFQAMRAQVVSGPSSHADPKLDSLLDKANACSLSYYKQFRQFVAEEKQIQKRYRKDGSLAEQRTILSDYYVVSLPSNPREAIEFRDTISVDDRMVRRDLQKISQLLNRKSSDLESEIQRINKESTKYYIANRGLGDLANTWYRYASPECREHIVYQLQLDENAPGTTFAILQFHETGQETLIHFRDLFGRTTPIPVSGSYYLSGPNALLVKVDITVFWGAERAHKIGRWIKEYKLGPEGVMVPACFRTIMYQGRSERTFLETESTYSRFRRFAADVKLMTGDPIEVQE